jgi:hypothetical protein
MRIANEMSDCALSKQLWRVLKVLPGDYKEYGGQVDREWGDEWGPDCSCGCRHFVELAPEDVGADWGVCANPKSHRAGLLTWEHQGCRHCEEDE